MATKQTCDRCGKECGWWSFSKMVRFADSFWNYSSKDLCSDCVKELNKFMKGAKVVE